MPSLQFSGEERFAADPATVFAALTDIEALAASIPDVDSWQRIDDRNLHAVVRPGFSFLKGTLKLQVALAEMVPNESLVQTVEAQGIGLSMRVESRMRIEPDGAGTRIAWQADVRRMKGLVATISPGLVKAAADQVVRDGWKHLHERLGETV